MVILDEEAATERSPLKGQNPPLPPQSSQQGAPPPPYAPSAPSSPVHPQQQQGLLHGYQSIPPHQHFPHPHAHPHHPHSHHPHAHPHPHQHYQEESPALLIRRDTPGQRFLKAFLCAVFVLFLWSLFIDTVSMVAGHRHRYGGYIRRGPWNDRLREGVREGEDLNSNTNHTSSAPCPCATSTPSPIPPIKMDPIRVIPIQYPPVRVEMPSVIPPPRARTVPCASATPTASAGVSVVGSAMPTLD